MALSREGFCKHSMNGAFFQQCVRLYTAYHSGSSRTFEVTVFPTDLPLGHQINPSESEVIAVADAKATSMYNAWVALLPNTPPPDINSGNGGVVIP